ncbi:hypothetical protein CLG96_03075 [Sphingomonas oleivorans]|uniref:Uncharacterized protein n=1 Tax=Sphingomonas oleivorans TaxID=1735121 RepID=A0A2T5G1U2_9SPHN|nr:hypothetical protein [Sphingomonas oleivorans]PTQ13127.1 hypothetical protein CLG96_03075 [Sphingomonas oleivorans]
MNEIEATVAGLSEGQRKLIRRIGGPRPVQFGDRSMEPLEKLGIVCATSVNRPASAFKLTALGVAVQKYICGTQRL